MKNLKIIILSIVILLLIIELLKIVKYMNSFQRIQIINNKFKKIMVIIPMGGIGNRLQFINSTYKLANNLKRKLYVIWPVNHECKIHYNQIFKYPKLNFYNEKYVPLNGKIYYNYESNIKYIPQTFKNYSKHCINKIHLDNSNVVFCCDFIYKKFDSDLLHRELLPTNLVKDKINKLMPKNKKILGIHIRCSDRVDCLNNSILNKIYKNISRIKKIYPNHYLFLATDDKNIKEKLVSDFNLNAQNNILTENNNNKINIIRNTQNGMIDAIVELFILAYSDIILCLNLKSTFTKSAIKIGNIQKNKQFLINVK